MSVTKNVIARFRIIDHCLSNRRQRYWTIDALREKIMEHDIVVSRRTIEIDLKLMRYDEQLAYFAPIEYCRKNKGHYYADPEYSIGHESLTKEDLDDFQLQVHTIQKYWSAQLAHVAEGVFGKLKKVAAHLKRKAIHAEVVIEFEKIPTHKGMEHFDVLRRACEQRQPLCITYKESTGNEKKYILHPYLLKEYKNMWHVLGYQEQHKKIAFFALDRIISIEERLIAFQANDHLDARKYFENTIGVTATDQPVESVELCFSPSQARYVETLPLHPTQCIVRETGEGLFLTLQLIVNDELVQMLLSFGPEVRVIAPESLRNYMRDMLALSLRHYAD